MQVLGCTLRSAYRRSASRINTPVDPTATVVAERATNGLYGLPTRSLYSTVPGGTHNFETWLRLVSKPHRAATGSARRGRLT